MAGVSHEVHLTQKLLGKLMQIRLSMACVLTFLVSLSVQTGLSGNRVSAQTPPGDVLARARAAELVLGDLTEALRLYGLILENHRNQRALCAEALFRSGMCHERLADGQAIQIYEQLRREYGEQSNWLAAAAERLRILDASDLPDSSIRTAFEVMALPVGAASAALSNDGSFLVYADALSGDLVRLDIGSGDQRWLTHRDGALPGGGGIYAVAPVTHPDGRRIAYNLRVSEGDFQVRVLEIDTGQDRLILEDSRYRYLEPLDWHPDGETLLLYFVGESEVTELLEVGTTDGTLNSLGRVVSGPPMSARYDRTGSRVALDMAEDLREVWGVVSIVDLSGRPDLNLPQNPEHDVLIDWVADDRGLLVFTEMPGRTVIHVVQVDKGLQIGTTLEVGRLPGRARPLAGHREGPNFFLQTGPPAGPQPNSDWFGIPGSWVQRMAEFYAEQEYGLGRRDFGEVHELGHSLVGAYLHHDRFTAYRLSVVPSDAPADEGTLLNGSFPMQGAFAWSPDGTRVAWVTPPPLIAWFDERPLLMVRSLEGRGFASLNGGLYLCGGALAWMPDGRSLVVSGRDEAGVAGLFELPLEGSDPRLLVPTAPEQCFELVIAPGGRHLFWVEAGQDGAGWALRGFDRETGETVPYHYSEGRLIGLTLSPDEQLLGLLERTGESGFPGTWRLLSLDPERPGAIEVTRLSGRRPVGTAWSGTRTLDVFAACPDPLPDGVTERWSIDLTTGAVTTDSFGPPAAGKVSAAPDGSRLLLTRPLPDGGTRLLRLDGLGTLARQRLDRLGINP